MRTIIGVVLGVAALVIGLTFYLGPNDLSGCGDQPSSKEGCRQANAIVAISGGDTTARTNEAIRLYQNGWAPKLVFSGAAQDKSGPSNAEVMRRLALAAGIPDSAIIIEDQSATTEQNAQNTQSIFTENHISSVILVTSAYHQRRAGLEFTADSAAGISVRNHPVEVDKQWSAIWWLTPGGWFLALSEVVKILAFYLGGAR